MSALITHTLDEDLKILLIAHSSQLAQLLVEKIQQQAEVKVELVSPSEFKRAAFINENWYKVILLFEGLLSEYLPFLEKLCFLPSKTVAIMPITTAIVADQGDAPRWKQQLDDEMNLFSALNKKIDVSGFLFYTDLVKGDSELLRLFFSKLERGLLVDPNIEIKPQTVAALTSSLASCLLKPRKKAVVISGKSVMSTRFLQEIKRLYLSQHQLNLPIKTIQLVTANHSITSSLKDFDQETTVEKITSISRQAVSFMKSVGRRKRRTDDQEPLLAPPVPLVSSPQKMRLDLERDLNESKGKCDEQPSLIDGLFKDYRAQQRKQHLQKLTKSTRVGLRKLKGQKFLFGGGILISLLALSILISVGVFFSNLSRAQGSLISYLESRSMPVTAQQKKLVEMGKTVDSLEGKLALINKWFSTPFFSESFQLIEISRLIVNLYDQVEGLEQATAAFFKQLMGQEKSGSLDLVNKESAEVFKTLSILSAELKNYSLDKFSPAQSQLINNYQALIKEQEKRINQFQQLSPLLPALLAQDETKTYAVVLQNEQELRPTGGFIQAVALLTFKEGVLINFQVEDVYTLDQQLKASITPPDEIEQYLGEERWYLRDSNWDPNFPKTAERIKWFLEKSIAVKVDGVMGINLRVLEEMVAILDQVEVDEYNEVLTKRNLGERMEFHSEVQLVETAQKRDYGELILFKILDKIQHLPSEQVTPLLSSLVKMADSKELLITVFDDDLQTTFESLGWSGSVVEPACPSVFTGGECLVDALMQVEANVGVNKANYYLERQIDHSVTVTPTQIFHKRVIIFKNKAQTNTWPKGAYKSYIRFYLPEKSDFKDIRINGQSVELSKLMIKKEFGRKVVGVLVEVAVKSELKLQLDYSLPYEYQSPFTYAFFDQKQPGARTVLPRIFINYDPDLSPTLIAPQAEVQGEVIVFNPSKDSGHAFVGVSFE